MATSARPSTVDRLFPASRPDADGPWLEVGQYWNDVCVETQHFKPGRPVTVGDGIGHRWSFLGVDIGWVSPTAARVLPFLPPVWSEVTPMVRADVHTPDGAPAELVSWDGEAWVLRTAGTVRVVVDGTLHEDRGLCTAGLATMEGGELVLPVQPGMVVEAVVGTVHLLLRAVPRAAAMERQAAAVDTPFSALLGSFGGLALLLMFVVATAPAPPQTDLSLAEDRIVELALVMPKKKEEKKKAQSKPETSAEEDAAEAEPTEGKRGKGPKDKKADRKAARKMQDRQIAENAGLIGAMKDMGMEALFGSGALGDELVGAAHGLMMVKGGGGPGGFGLGERGLGRGLNADGIGDVWGAGGGPGGREGFIPGGRKSEGDGLSLPRESVVVGALDRSQIDEVVKRHLQAIRYCYQRELQRNPGLGGKVVVKFTIAGDGSVSSAKVRNSTVGHAGVDQCVAGRFLRMQFPEPAGNGLVIVSYPFLFSPG